MRGNRGDKVRTYGVGVVGLGKVSAEHIKAYISNSHTEVVALCSRNRERIVQKMAQLNLECAVYTDYEKMLSDPRVDIVSICTPNDLHATQAIKAARAGKHMLIEKPVALNLEELRTLREAVREARVKAMAGFVLRWNPLVRIVKSIVDDGTLGELFMAEVDYLHGGRGVAAPEWMYRKTVAGSSLLMSGCHAVDIIRWLVGSEVAEVTAYSSRHDLRFEYEPTTLALLRFENGVIGKVASSREVEMRYVFNLELFGTKGTIMNNRLWATKLAGQTDFATIPSVMPDTADVTHHPFGAEIAHLVECILEDREPIVGIDDTYRTHEVCLAADISAAQDGRKVNLPLP